MGVNSIVIKLVSGDSSPEFLTPARKGRKSFSAYDRYRFFMDSFVVFAF